MYAQTSKPSRGLPDRATAPPSAPPANDSSVGRTSVTWAQAKESVPRREGGMMRGLGETAKAAARVPPSPAQSQCRGCVRRA